MILIWIFSFTVAIIFLGYVIARVIRLIDGFSCLDDFKDGKFITFIYCYSIAHPIKDDMEKSSLVYASNKYNLSINVIKLFLDHYRSQISDCDVNLTIKIRICMSYYCQGDNNASPETVDELAGFIYDNISD